MQKLEIKTSPAMRVLFIALLVITCVVTVSVFMELRAEATLFLPVIIVLAPICLLAIQSKLLIIDGDKIWMKT